MSLAPKRPRVFLDLHPSRGSKQQEHSREEICASHCLSVSWLRWEHRRHYRGPRGPTIGPPWFQLRTSSHCRSCTTCLGLRREHLSGSTLLRDLFVRPGSPLGMGHDPNPTHTQSSIFHSSKSSSPMGLVSVSKRLHRLHREVEVVETNLPMSSLWIYKLPEEVRDHIAKFLTCGIQTKAALQLVEISPIQRPSILSVLNG